MQLVWKKWWMKYKSKEIMALRVGPIPQKCNVSNHGIANICNTIRNRNNLHVEIIKKGHTPPESPTVCIIWSNHYLFLECWMLYIYPPQADSCTDAQHKLHISSELFILISHFLVSDCRPLLKKVRGNQKMFRSIREHNFLIKFTGTYRNL